MEIFIPFIVLAVCGVGIGILSGMLGIGGGTVMIPLFRLAVGMSPLASTATSLFAIVPTSISGVVAHLRNNTCYISFGIAAGLGGACTSPVGVWLATQSPGWVVIVGTAIVIAYSASSMLYKAIRYKPVEKTGASSADDPQDTTPGVSTRKVTSEIAPDSEGDRKFTFKQLVGAFGIGVIGGLLAGYVGLGGGFLMVPLMVSFYGMSMKYASGTSLIIVTILAIPGVISHAIYGNIDYLAGLAVVVGSIPGAFIGARLVKRVPERGLRFFFGGFLIIAAIMLVVNELMLV